MKLIFFHDLLAVYGLIFFPCIIFCWYISFNYYNLGDGVISFHTFHLQILQGFSFLLLFFLFLHAIHILLQLQYKDMAKHLVRLWEQSDLAVKHLSQLTNVCRHICLFFYFICYCFALLIVLRHSSLPYKRKIALVHCFGVTVLQVNVWIRLVSLLS